MSTVNDPPDIESPHATADDQIEGMAGEVLIDPLTGNESPVHSGVRHVPEQWHVADDDTDEQIVDKLRRQGVRIGKGNVAPAVFWPSLTVIVAIVVFAAVAPGVTSDVFSEVQGWIVSELSWYYMLVIAFFIVFVIGLAFSKFGKITLGRGGEPPEFSRLTWFCMLFAAGMGIGLVFYGVGEPLTYAAADGGAKPGWPQEIGADRSGLAMAQTFVHWGLHPWAIYAVIGLALAFAIHRRGRPVSIRWALEPVLGDRVKGWMGDVIDVLAIFGTVFGVATSLGLGVKQIASGMESIGIIDTHDNLLLVILIVVITFLATLSVVSGLGAGIKWLSNINLSVAGILLISVLLLGPTLFLLRNLVQSIGVYFANVLGMTFDVSAYQGAAGEEWLSTWTIFYWGWWIAWAPFVGVFIARISRGRTVREFIIGCLAVPTVVGMIWFSVLGGAGIHRQLFGEGDLVEDGQVSAEGALFHVLDGLPLGMVFSVIAIILVAVFFITSSDSGSLVVDMLASGGHPNPPIWSRVLFAVTEGVVAVTLLLAGGLESLQAASLATALPFSVILVIMCVATLRGLAHEYRVHRIAEQELRLELAKEHITGEVVHTIPGDPAIQDYVDDRIDYRISRTRGMFAKSGKHPTGRDTV